MLKTDVDVSGNDSSLGANPLSLHEFNEIALGRKRIHFSPPPYLRERLERSSNAVNDAVKNDHVVYGVNTGFGALADQSISCDELIALQENLLSFLAAGSGGEIDAVHVRGAMLLRASVLLQGKSGVRIELIERLVEMLNQDAVPLVREFGSIGASGDLVPLSTIARAATGHPHVKVRLHGEIVDGPDALKILGLERIELQPKEGLALVNGTSFSAAIAANATNQARNLLAVTFAAQALMMTALQVDCRPFAAFVHLAKPHLGQVWSAKLMRQLLDCDKARLARPASEVQDCYSLRCFPQYTGAIVEGIARIQKVVQIEMNGVSDNPLVDPDSGTFFQSGNFLGQYIAMAMDDLRRDIGLLAKHLDVQIALLVTPEFSRGLSPSLRGNDGRHFNMGLKGLQICGNSIMPMLNYLGQPLTHLYPTHAEQYNQNVNGLSWGSANLAWQSVKTFSQYLSVSLLCAVQAVDLRAAQVLGHYDGAELLGDVTRKVYCTVLELLDGRRDRDKPFLFNDQDRWLENDVEALARGLFLQGELIDAVKPILHSFDGQFGNDE